MRRTILLLALLCSLLPLAAADLAVRSTTGRTVLRRGETADFAVHLRAPAPVETGTLEFWLDEPGQRTRLGSDVLDKREAGPLDLTYRLQTGKLRAGVYRLRVRALLNGQPEEAAVPLEIAGDVPLTDFKIFHCTFPTWLLPTGKLMPDSQRYHFNFLLNNVGDSWNRGGAGVGLTGAEQTCEEMVRYGLDYLKYPTVYGWGLAHRPIRTGASWYDPDIIDISAQLTQYHTQAARRFPVFKGLDPIDEPGVSWSDPHMAAAFKKQTGLDAPAKDDRTDVKRYAAYQVFRNHVLENFNQEMKLAMLEVDQQAMMSCQTFADILTREGLYPAGNTFLDIQSTHIYDHWPTSNNWMSFDVNLRRANRPVFWKRPLIVMTGCYGIAEDQWRAAWALGMSEKLDGHGYFLGAGELPESMPWVEYSLAEIVRINRLNEQYGNFFLGLEKPVEPLALWYSLAQAAAADPARNYEQEVVGAYYALKRAHFPVTIVTDEDLRAGLLKEHKVLLMIGMDEVPGELRDAVTRFVGQGGAVVADRTTTLPVIGQKRMDVDFREYAANFTEVERAWFEKRMGTSMLLRRDLPSEASILRDLDKVTAALAPLVARPVRAQSPHTFLAVQQAGEARYIFVANEASVVKHPNEGLRWITMQESVPATERLAIAFAKGKTVYDLWTGKPLLPDADGLYPVRLPMAGLRVLCVYPRPVKDPAPRAQVTPDGMLQVTIDGQTGNAGLLPAALDVRDPAGNAVLRQYVAVNLSPRAANRWSYAIGANEQPGTWQVRLTNLLTQHTTTAAVAVKGVTVPSLLARLDPVTIFDSHAYAGFVKRKPLIVPGTGCEQEAVLLQAAIGGDIRKPEEIRKPDALPEFLDPEKQKGAWMMPRWQPLALTVGADVLLLGTPENNILIKDINQSGVLTRVIHASTLGKGQGLIQYAWSPFDRDKDAVLLSAYDAEGLQAAIRRFIAVTGNRDDRGKDLPLPATITREPQPAGPSAAPALVAPLQVTTRVTLDDNARKLASGGELLAVGGQDGRLYVFNQRGVLLWQRDFDYRVIGVAVSPDGQYVAAAAFPRTYIYDRKGTLLYFTEAVTPSMDDVEGLAVQAGDTRLLKGTWTGTVQACDATGKLQWSFPAPPVEVKDAPKPEPPKPLSPIRSLSVLPDGTIAAGVMDQLLLLGADGKELARKKVDRLQVVQAAGDKLVVASFKKKLSLLDGKGETLWTKDTPDFIMAADATADGRTIAVALFGGEVQCYGADGTLLRRARLPFEASLTGIALDETGTSAWLTTWEGEMLRVTL